ncbi:uncharacterized protein LOC116842247 [Odontomachus brunneus]|uniref:uncharacterized protein LOC116842247 n=1 Tax=Odontomachus brunneus TaxID=486640 RepID=UPI0013F1E958|nr:uncharacterized protein LOC116842247 [Odontomachus brunneus]
MKSAWLIFATVCAASCSMVIGLDLGRMIWTAQCHSECLRQFDKYELLKPAVLDEFNECAKYCKICHDEKNTKACWRNELKRTSKHFRQKRALPEGQLIACRYCKTRELTNYEASMLPAPENKPISMGPHDVAIVFQREYQRDWDFQDFYYGRSLTGTVHPCYWIIVVTSENSPRHYSWQQWVPNLESLKEGPLVEATISWRNASEQLQFQQKHEETKMMQDHKRHLQLSSENVLKMTIDNKTQRALIQQLFWKPDASERKLSRNKYWARFSQKCRYYIDDGDSSKSFVVTWGPETGGLTGNQVTDGDSAQISLLPGVKYQVRVASNNGPGSFPIIIDTRHFANHTPPSPPASSSSVCEGICCVKLFAYTGWQYVLVLFLIAILLYCYIWVNSWRTKKLVQTWEKASQAKMIPLLFACCLGFLVAPYQLAPSANNGLIGVGALTVVSVGFAAGPRYVPKWKKQACEIPASQHPNSHYICDEAGEVKCLPGWTGDLCDVPICRKGCDPLQGYCRRPGECRCKLGFYGDLCDKCVALPGCQHGRCNVSFECSCDPGWKGMFCSEPICAPDCLSSQGYCEKPGECRCRLGWQGPKCKQCAVLPGCAHGTCQGPLECRCDPGWTGLLCQTPICAQGCSRNHGGCRQPGTCRCRTGWTGPNCTECVPYPGCVHGSCKRPWECRCEPGWAGDLCNEKLTYCDEHPGVCQNNATCISMTHEDGNYRCICPLGYMGRQCQIKTTVPSTELVPPMPDTSGNLGLAQEAQDLADKPSIEVASSEDKKVPVKAEEVTAEPLGPIVITDPPTTVDPAATAGKWPTESATESLERDDENET